MNPKDLPSLAECQVLDVRLADDFEACHLTGAENNCVFEVAFTERLAETAPDLETKTVVYGSDARSGESAAALEKMIRLGYSDIHVLEGGIAAAEEAGIPVTKGTPLPAPPTPPSGRLAVNTADSVVQWTGRNLLNKHLGTIEISDGILEFEDGKLVHGLIHLDLKTLQCIDLQGTELHDVLIAHLHDDDFFDVSRHPVATLEVTGAEAVPEPSPGSPNLQLTANLTLRGQTQPISFHAATGTTPEGNAAAQAVFSIDRTRWGVLYGSGKLFHRLAGHLVNDLIDFDIKIETS